MSHNTRRRIAKFLRRERAARRRVIFDKAIKDWQVYFTEACHELVSKPSPFMAHFEPPQPLRWWEIVD